MKVCIAILLFSFNAVTFVISQNLNWVRQTGGILNDNAVGLTVDDELNIYSLVNFSGNITMTTGQNFSSFGKEDFLVTKNAPSGALIWARKFGGRESDFVHDISTDAANNIYVTGTFRDTLRLFDQLLLTSEVSSVNVGFLLKISPGGDILWSRGFQTNNGSFPLKAKVQQNGDIVVAGNFEGSVDFDPGPGQQTLTSTGLMDIFFLKLNVDGNLIWVKKIGGADAESINDFETDNAGNIISLGQYNQIVDFDPGPGEFFTTHNGGTDVFIHQLNQNGHFNWVRSIGGGGFDAGLGIDVAPDQDIVIVGRFSNSVDFNPAINQSFTMNSEGSWDGFVLRLNTGGDFRWAKKIGGSQNDQCTSVDVSSTNIIAVGGIFRTTVNFNPNIFPNQFSTSLGGTDIFQLLLNADGSYNTHVSLGGAGNEQLNKIRIYSLNNVLSVGNFVNIVDFDPSQISANLTSTGNTDGFLLNIFNCVRPFIPSIISTADYVCRGESFTISLPGAQLNGANQWSWYQTSCNATSFATGTSITGMIIQNTVFYVRGTGGCLQTSDCRNIIVNAFTDTLTNQSFTICEGDSVQVGNNIYTASGLYLDTLVASVGCDSVVFTNLLVVSPSFLEQAFTICPGEEVLVGTKIYRNTGVYVDTLQGVNGCDSIITTSVSVIPVEIITQNIQLCQGESFVVGDSVYTETGVYVNPVLTPEGCENFIITTLTVYPLEYNITHNLCFGDTLRIGSENYTTSLIVVEFLGSSIGCDSIVNHTINFFDTSFESRENFLCTGDSLVVGNNVYKESGIYTDSLNNIAGCDSIIQSNVIFFDKPLDNEFSFRICEGQSILVNGKTYFSPGEFRDTLQTNYGCDSILIIRLEVLPTFTQNFYTICSGDSIIFGNQIIKQQGVYSKIFISSLGCDSTSTIIVSLINVVREFENVRLCEGNTYSVGFSTYSVPGIYLDTLTSSRGCDSIIQTTIFVTPETYQQSVSVCQGESLQVGNSVYNTTGIYTDSLLSSDGCDSIVITSLVVFPVDSVSQNITICSGKKVKVGNTEYGLTGTYTNVLQNKFGCDSIVETRLTVIPAPVEMIDTSICEGSLLKLGNFTFTLPGQYELYVANPGECDTLFKLNLKVVSITPQITRIADTLVAGDIQNALYQWYTCEPGLPPVLLASGKKFIPPSNGFYQLKITFNQCEFYSNCNEFIKTGINDQNNINWILYPNPVYDVVTITGDNETNYSEYQIVNEVGIVMQHGKLNGSRLDINVSDLPAGVYILLVYNQKVKNAFSLIKLNK